MHYGERMRLLPAALAVLTIAGCGGGDITDQVRDGYADYGKRHGFKAAALDVASVTCDRDGTARYDGWCRIRPKGFMSTYDVPYRDDKPLWGDSGMLKAP